MHESNILRTLLLSLLLTVALASEVDADGPEYPPRERLVDPAGILDYGERLLLLDRLEIFAEESNYQLFVVIPPSLEGLEIEKFADGLGQHWQTAEWGSNSIFLIAAPAERTAHIIVGQTLKGRLTGSIARSIMETDIDPPFHAIHDT